MRHQLNRRRFLGVTAGAAAVAATAHLGPMSAFAAPPLVAWQRSPHPAREAGDDHVHPAGCARTARHRGEQRGGRPADDGLRRRAGRSRTTRTISGRSFRCPVVGGSCSSSSPTSSTSRSSSPATARTPTTPAARPATTRARKGRGGVPRLRAEASRASWTSSTSRRSATMGSSRTRGRARTARAGCMSEADDAAVPDRAGVRRDPGHALHGYRQRPDERQQPQHRTMDDRRGEVGGAQRAQPRVGHPPLPAQPLAGLQLPPGRPDGDGHRASGDGRADPADAGAGRVRQAADAALHRHHRPGPLPARNGHLLGARRPAPAALALRLGRQPRRGHLRSARPGGQQTKRYPLFHAKDGDRTAEAPGVGNGYNRPVRRRDATSTSRTSSQTWAPRASTTRTTSRTTPLAGRPTQAGHCATRFSAHNMNALRG